MTARRHTAVIAIGRNSRLGRTDHACDAGDRQTCFPAPPFKIKRNGPIIRRNAVINLGNEYQRLPSPHTPARTRLMRWPDAGDHDRGSGHGAGPVLPRSQNHRTSARERQARFDFPGASEKHTEHRQARTSTNPARAKSPSKASALWWR